MRVVKKEPAPVKPIKSVWFLLLFCKLYSTIQFNTASNRKRPLFEKYFHINDFCGFYSNAASDWERTLMARLRYMFTDTDITLSQGSIKPYKHFFTIIKINKKLIFFTRIIILNGKDVNCQNPCTDIFIHIF